MSDAEAGDKSRFCLHCGRPHPESEMRLVNTRGGRRWRCKAGLEATRLSAAKRDEFGRTTSEKNQERGRQIAAMNVRRSATPQWV